MPLIDEANEAEAVAVLAERLPLHKRRLESIDAYIEVVEKLPSVFGIRPPVASGGYADLSQPTEQVVKAAVLVALLECRDEVVVHIDRVESLLEA